MHLLPTFHPKVTIDDLAREQKPYYDQEMILRDYLAADRTSMANERLLLAYVRTALAMVGAGAALLHFQKDTLGLVVGGLLASSGLVVGIIGLVRFRSTRGILMFLKQTSHAKALPREGKE